VKDAHPQTAKEEKLLQIGQVGAITCRFRQRNLTQIIRLGLSVSLK